MSLVIHDFLNNRKEEWLKKKLTADMSEADKSELLQEANTKYALAMWLPDAAKRAGQLSMATHPGKFSHPSAKTSSIIADAECASDGYLRTGNITYDLDVFGNAAAMDVYKFLSLTLENGQTVLDHLELDSPEIKAIFTIPTAEFTTLKQGFLAVKHGDKSQITDGLVKQLYFPLEEDYHLLSILTPSGLLVKFKKKLDQMRFSDKAKEARECRKKEAYHGEGYDDIYDLTITAYGGTKPQNISVLNNQNGGVSYLLCSTPPPLKKRNIRLPTRNFFTNTLWIGDLKESFKFLHSLMKLSINNISVREAIGNILKHVIDRVLERAFQVRAFGLGWSTTEYYKDLPLPQRLWLDDIYIKERENVEEWLDDICDAFARWVIQAYKKTLKKEHINLGDAELQHIRDFVDDAVKNDKEFFK